VIIGYLLIGTDNTARKQVEEDRARAEEARRTSEARYRVLFECAPDGIVIANPEGVYLDANGSICEMLGYQRDELIGLPSSKIVAEREFDHIAPALREIQAKSPYHREWHFRRKDDSTFDAEVIATTMPDGKVLAMIRDVTERKNAELALRDSEERFRTMANSIPQLAWIARADGHRYWFNQRWYAYTGTTLEQMEGWGWKSAYHPEFVPAVLEAWHAAIANGLAFELEFPIRAADGQYRTFLTRIEPLRDPTGKLVNWFGTNTDVEELKRAEIQLKTSFKEINDLKRAQDEHAIVAITDPKGKITYVNEKFCAISKYSREELLGRDHRLINSGFHSKEFIQSIWDTISDEERKRLEEKMREAQKLESLGLIAGGVAHDFNNLLTGIMGNAAICRGKLHLGSPLHENLEKIQTTGQRAADLCKQMLAYAGKGKITHAAVDINTLVADTVSMANLSVSRKVAVNQDLAIGLRQAEGDSDTAPAGRDEPGYQCLRGRG
jgi:PAS domain S-box-containing protein